MPLGPAFATGKGLHGKSIPKRHRRILRDNLRAITKGDIRRLARRGGVYRIQTEIYDTARLVLKKRLEELIYRLTVTLGNSGDVNQKDGPLEGVIPKGRRTVTTDDVVFVLRRMGSSIYGFEPPYNGGRRRGIVP